MDQQHKGDNWKALNCIWIQFLFAKTNFYFCNSLLIQGCKQGSHTENSNSFRIYKKSSKLKIEHGNSLAHKHERHRYAKEVLNQNKGLPYLWWFKRVVWRKVNVQEKHSTLVHRALWTQNGGYPFIEVVPLWPGAENRGTAVGPTQPDDNLHEMRHAILSPAVH